VDDATCLKIVPITPVYRPYAIRKSLGKYPYYSPSLIFVFIFKSVSSSSIIAGVSERDGFKPLCNASPGFSANLSFSNLSYIPPWVFHTVAIASVKYLVRIRVTL